MKEYFKTDSSNVIINERISTTQNNNNCLFLTINNIKNNFNFEEYSIINTKINKVSININYNDSYSNTMNPFLEYKLGKKINLIKSIKNI